MHEVITYSNVLLTTNKLEVHCPWTVREPRENEKQKDGHSNQLADSGYTSHSPKLPETLAGNHRGTCAGVVHCTDIQFT